MKKRGQKTMSLDFSSKRGQKRGLSPVVATVLLVGMVIVIGLIIFLWFQGFQEEAVTKFDGKNIQLVCNEVNFDADYSDGILSLSNLGNVPIYEMNVKITKDGSHETINLKEIYDWPETGLNQEVISGSLTGGQVLGADEILLVPILRGTSNKGDRTYTCGEEFGKVA